MDIYDKLDRAEAKLIKKRELYDSKQQSLERDRQRLIRDRLTLTIKQNKIKLREKQIQKQEDEILDMISEIEGCRGGTQRIRKREKAVCTTPTPTKKRTKGRPRHRQ